MFNLLDIIKDRTLGTDLIYNTCFNKLNIECIKLIVEYCFDKNNKKQLRKIKQK